jgi:hypothetical protein
MYRAVVFTAINFWGVMKHVEFLDHLSHAQLLKKDPSVRNKPVISLSDVCGMKWIQKCSQVNVPCSKCSLQNRSLLIGGTVGRLLSVQCSGDWRVPLCSTQTSNLQPALDCVQIYCTVYTFISILSERMVLCSVGGWWYRREWRE